MKRLVFLLLALLAFQPSTWAGVEPTITVSQPGTVFMAAAPPVWGSMVSTPTATFTLKSVTNYVKLFSDQNSTTRIGFDYQLKVPVRITYYKYPNLTTNPVVVNETLTINYHPDPNVKREYQQADAFRFANGYKVQVQVQPGITATTLAGAALSATQKTDLAKTVTLQSETTVERYYKFSPAATSNFNTPAVDPNSNQLKISWTNILGAEEYDLEWVYVDDYDLANFTLPLAPAVLPYDFAQNAARVQIKSLSYNLPLVYERGWLLFRVRGIGRSAADNFVAPVPGAWSCGGGNCAYGFVGAFPAQSRYQITQAFENDRMNWQAVTTYAEEGKRKDLVKFVDGSNRIRQSVTVLSTDRMALVGETIYDYQGRAAIQPLPVPIKDERLRFFPNLNQHTQAIPTLFGPYGPKNFDYDQSNCQSKAEPMRSGTTTAQPNAGASNYYSPFNPLKTTGFYPFVPDAEEYPFTQTEFMPDNTGRVRRQSGVGKMHQLDSGHETSYFYGTPMQEELDRLFGNEVGNALHYKKNIVQDANGQISITYLDPKGNTVATALAGECPKELLPLDSYQTPTSVTVNLLAANVKDTVNYALTTVRTLTVSSAGDYDFVYMMTGQQYQDLTCMAAKVCYDCIYDLELEVKDNLCNKIPFQHKTTIGKLMEILQRPGKPDTLVVSTQCETPPFQFNTATDLVPVGKTFKVNLPVGTYTVTKRLTVNQAAADAYLDHFLNDPGNKCSQKFEEFLKTEMAKIDTSDCHLDCGDIDYSVLKDPNLTPDQVKELQAELDDLKESLCDSTLSLCETAYAAMLADVSPGGQYGYIPGTTPTNPYDPYVSVFAPNSRLKNGGALAIFRNPNLNIDFKDEKGATFKIDLGSGPVKINDLSVDMQTFLNHWREEWAEELVQFHPEYCYYQYCLDYLQKPVLIGTKTYSSEAYDMDMAATPTLAAAADVTKGFVSATNPTAIADNDPFYKGAVPGASLSAIQSKINKCVADYNNSAITLSMRQLATVLANCPANPAACSGAAGMTSDKEWEIYRMLYQSAKQEHLYQLRTQYALTNQCYNGCIGDESFRWWQYVGSGSGWGFPFAGPRNCCDVPNFWYFLKKAKRFPSVHDLLPKDFTPDFYSAPPKNVLDSLAGNDAPNMCCDIERHFPQFLMQLLKNYKPPQPLTFSLLAGDPAYPMDVLNAIFQHSATPGQTSLPVTISYNKGTYTVQIGSCQLKFTLKNPQNLAIKDICCFVIQPGGQTFQMTVTLPNTKPQPIQGNMIECPLRCPDPKPECPPTEEASELVVLLNYLAKNNSLNTVNNLPAVAVGPYISGAMGGPLLPGASWQWQGTQVPGQQGTSTFGIKILNSGTQTCTIDLTLPSGVPPTQLDYCIGLWPDLKKIGLNGHTRGFVSRWKLKNGTTRDLEGVSGCFTISFCCNPYVIKADPPLFGINKEADILKNCRTCQTLTVTGGIFDGTATQCPINCDSIKEYVIPVPNPCVQHLLDLAKHNAEQLYGYYLDSLKAAVRQNYLRHCLSAAEQFFVTYRDNQHHFTLYYYDQANNLVKTVPPAGVVPLAVADLALVTACRNDPKFNQPKYPAHTLVSQYRYNSLNQLTWQKIPDHTKEDLFFYDGLGRLVASVNARQVPPSNVYTRGFSYTRYDALGRIVEVGESRRSFVGPYSGFLSTLKTKAMDYKNWDAFVNAGVRTEITRTEYDRPVASFSGKNLRGRVASVTRQPNTAPAAGTTSQLWYSYDIHGNVGTLVQKSFLLDPKTVEYDYDLVSGKVNSLAYQRGQTDQFLHRYAYDADNRITEVRTSPDGIFWDKDAAYLYYKHGPLARTELGDARVQGLDYLYTLHGWIKSVNAVGLRPNQDPGLDGNTLAQGFARDATGYLLGYYAGDYKPIGAVSTPTVVPTTAAALYNGNIRQMVIAIEPFMFGNNSGNPLASDYAYDQLNRLRSATYNQPVFDKTANAWLAGPADMRWKNTFTYDANGNILTQQRNGDKVAAAATSFDMDEMKYSYYPGTNQLQIVADAVPKGNYLNIDIDDQTTKIVNGQTQSVTKNYLYDPIGNLTTDVAESLTIQWNLQGKVSKIVDAVPAQTIDFGYDPMGNRVLKTVNGESTYHALDASGNVLATYRRLANGKVILESSWIFGSSRLGEYRAELCVGGTCVAIPQTGHSYHITGKRRYEESNHLGNVLAVVSDRKMPVPSGATVTAFRADTVGAQDYYAFGMLMPGRTTASGAGRFGFNGKENVDEVEGKGNYQDYGMRAYDGRLGRFFSVDPITRDYPELTPFQFASNRPIDGIDLDGLEHKQYTHILDKRGNVIKTFDDSWALLRVGELGWGELHIYRTEDKTEVYRKMINYTPPVLFRANWPLYVGGKKIASSSKELEGEDHSPISSGEIGIKIDASFEGMKVTDSYYGTSKGSSTGQMHGKKSIKMEVTTNKKSIPTSSISAYVGLNFNKSAEESKIKMKIPLSESKNSDLSPGAYMQVTYGWTNGIERIEFGYSTSNKFSLETTTKVLEMEHK